MHILPGKPQRQVPQDLMIPFEAPAPLDESITPVLQPFVDSRSLAGAVTLVASKDKVLSLAATGYADISANQQLRTDAMFWIASMTKPMTSTALMMLVDKGEVDLEAPVESYLPEFKDQMIIVEQNAEHVLLKKPSHPITVKNVLSHTAGLRFSSPMEQPTLDGICLRDSVRSHAMLPLRWEPDSRYDYSNAGTNTAARILEVVTGIPYAEFLQERLLDPLGMNDTTFWPSKEQVQRLAKVYKSDAANSGLEETVISQLSYPLTDRARHPMPAGGLFSTAQDVVRFCQMILNSGVLDGKKYVSEESVKQMTRKQTGEAIQEGYGLAWAINEGRFGHGGALGTNMEINPANGLITIFMVQHAGFPGDGAKSHDAFKEWAEKQFCRAVSE